MPISIYLVDDHQVFQDGIASLISFEKDMEVVGTAASVETFMQQVRECAPDLVLMDISLGDGSGISAAKWYKANCPTCKILMLSMHRDEKYVRQVIEAGADGYLLKDAGTEEMMAAIRTVAGGNSFYSRQIFGHIITSMQKKPGDRQVGGSEKLTRRELQVIKLIAEEKSNQEIADELFISIRTVDTHRQNLLQKTGARNTAGLVKYALRNDLIKL